MLEVVILPRPTFTERLLRIFRERKLPDRTIRSLERAALRLGLLKPSRIADVGHSRMIVRRGTWDPQMMYQVMVREDYTSHGFSLQEGDIVIDIGANIGSFAVFAGKKASTVISFEPAASAFELLSQNVALNGLNNVQAVRAAVGGKDGEIILYKGSDDAINTIHKDSANGGKHGQEAVPCITLDTVFARFGITRCDFLKLDCEGAEYDILYSASDSTLQRISRISMEYHVLDGQDEDEVPRGLCNYLSGKGFEPVRHVQFKGARCGMLRFERNAGTQLTEP